MSYQLSTITKDQSFITLTYLIETSGSPERLAAKIASDQSTGTFVPVPGETEELKNRVAARIVAIRNLPAATTPAFRSRHMRANITNLQSPSQFLGMAAMPDGET